MSTAAQELVTKQDQAIGPRRISAAPFPADVWRKLSRIDVGDHIENKGGFSYLSWAWAWAQLMEHFPESTFKPLKPRTQPDGTMSVRVAVTAEHVGDKLTRKMWLPVMDNRNNAIPNPNERNINDSTMRCLVKCLALFGLGLDVYAKSDMPVGAWDDAISEAQAELLHGLLESSGADVKKFLEWLGAEAVEQIPASKYKMARTQLERKAKESSK